MKRLLWAHLWAQKHDASEGYCEDAFAASEATFAVCDGAAQGYLSGRWARLLASAVVEVAPTEGVQPAVEIARESWRQALVIDEQRRADENRPLKWYEQLGIEKGAGATLVVVEFQDSETNEGGRLWHAWAIGDSCLFLVRDGALTLSWPLETSAEFGFAPMLIGSDAAPDSHLGVDLQEATRAWRVGDKMYLMTDAVAKWFLTECEQDRQPWEWIDKLSDIETRTDEERQQQLALFREAISSHREHGFIRDDDVTIVRLVAV